MHCRFWLQTAVRQTCGPTGTTERPFLVNALSSRIRNAPRELLAVMQNFGWMIASRGLAAVLSLIYLAIITRTLGASGFGAFALITGAAQFLANLLAFQTWQIIVQYGVSYIESGDRAKLSRLYRIALALDIASVVMGIVAAAVILYFFADEFSLKPTLARATLIFSIIILVSVRSTPLGILRLRDRFNLAAAADSATPTLRLVGAVTVTFVHPTLQAFLIAWAIAELLTAVAHWYAVHRVGDLTLIFKGKGGLKPALEENPGLLRYAVTASFAQSLVIAAKQIPLFLVGGLTGTAAAGAFRLAAQLSRSLTTVSQLVARAAFPEIVRAVRNEGVGSLGGVIASSVRIAFAVCSLVFFFVVLFGQLLLEAIGGQEFAQAYYSLLWLAAAACTELVIVAFEPSIMAAHRAHLAFLARLAATVIMIGCALLLEPVMGAEGVAAAVLAYTISQALLLGLVLLGLIRGKPETVLPEG